MKIVFFCFLFCLTTLLQLVQPELKYLDDESSYEINFDVPLEDSVGKMQNNIKAFYTPQLEKYTCEIPNFVNARQDASNEKFSNEPSPFSLLKPLFNESSRCAYKGGKYWHYEVCHGRYVRQFHPERKGDKFLIYSYTLGNINETEMQELQHKYEQASESGLVLNKTHIFNNKYPYFEMQMLNGTKCTLIKANRSIRLRYVCHPHMPREHVYDVQEVSSCSYIIVVLTNLLCKNKAFVTEKYSNSLVVKCSNSPTASHKPLHMLQEDLSAFEWPAKTENRLAANAMLNERSIHTAKFGQEIDERLLLLVTESIFALQPQSSLSTYANFSATPNAQLAVAVEPIQNLAPLRGFFLGLNCLFDHFGWWKYEFCYGKHLRVFQNSRQQDIEYYLGYFHKEAQHHWLQQHSDKIAKHNMTGLWHHYGQGTKCVLNDLPRNVTVQMICVPDLTAELFSMKLSEPNICEYILLLKSPIICLLQRYKDEFELISFEKIAELFQEADVGNYEQKKEQLLPVMLSLK